MATTSFGRSHPVTSMPNLNRTIRPESGSLSTAVASLGVGGVPLSRRALAIIVAVTLLASSAGCMSWRVHQSAVRDVLPTDRSIRIWLPDHSRLTLDDTRVAGDTLYGRVVEHVYASEPLSVGSTATVVVGQLPQIPFETRELDAGRSIALFGGGLLVVTTALVFVVCAVVEVSGDACYIGGS